MLCDLSNTHKITKSLQPQQYNGLTNIYDAMI